MVDVGDETTYDWDWDHHSMDGVSTCTGSLEKTPAQATCYTVMSYACGSNMSCQLTPTFYNC
jgi:hypothetical protein